MSWVRTSVSTVRVKMELFGNISCYYQTKVSLTYNSLISVGKSKYPKVVLFWIVSETFEKPYLYPNLYKKLWMKPGCELCGSLGLHERLELTIKFGNVWATHFHVEFSHLWNGSRKIAMLCDCQFNLCNSIKFGVRTLLIRTVIVSLN